MVGHTSKGFFIQSRRSHIFNVPDCPGQHPEALYARHWLASRRSAGERPERVDRDRTTQKHHADKRSRTRRRIQAMTLAPRREDHRLCPSRYSNPLAAPPASPRRLCSMICGHDGLRSSASRGLKPALPHACGRCRQTRHAARKEARYLPGLGKLLHAIECRVRRGERETLSGVTRSKRRYTL